MISFEPLQITLIKNKLSKTEFAKKLGISSATAAKMWRDEYIAMSVIDNICNTLQVPITDVIVHIPDNESSTSLDKVEDDEDTNAKKG
jgi:Predicted transcriptional regulator